MAIEVAGAPDVMGYCHCGDCAAWAAAAINSFGYWPANSVRIAKGEDRIGTFNKTANVYRRFCKVCGGHVFTDIGPGNSLMVYPNAVPGLAHEPTLHVHYGSKTVSVRDGLPKFKDLPTETGGSGEILPD